MMQLPVWGSFDWYAIAMFLVSWYAAAAGNAAAAHFRPRTALAVVLCALLAAGLLLSGAVAPTLRALHRTASPLYSLTGVTKLSGSKAGHPGVSLCIT